MSPRGSGGCVTDANKHPLFVSAHILLLEQGSLYRGTPPRGQKCRSTGGLWSHEKFPNTAEAISVSAIKKEIFSPYNCSNDIMMSDHLFCKANSELSHFSCSEMYLVVFLFGGSVTYPLGHTYTCPLLWKF